ncbi:hypothetical protein [Hyphococcus luteus]|nr:hypothetical protein [Marinicaulis flavus]
MNEAAKKPGRMAIGCLIALLAPMFLYVAGSFAIWSITSFDNLTYARTFFSRRVQIEEVIASKRWHDGGFGCTYAAVVFTEETAKKIRTSGPDALFSKPDRSKANSAAYWDGEWRPTPMPDDSRLKAMFDNCLHEINPDYTKVIQGMFNEHGSYYSTSRTRVGVISEKTRIAIVLRFGD